MCALLGASALLTCADDTWSPLPGAVGKTLHPWWQRARECSKCQAGSPQALVGCTEGATDPRAGHPWGCGTEQHNLSSTWGSVQAPGCGTRVGGWLMFACPLAAPSRARPSL